MPMPTPGVGPPAGVLGSPARSLALMLTLSPLAPRGVRPPNAPGAGVRTALPGVRGVRGVRVPGVRGLVPRRRGGSGAAASGGAGGTMVPFDVDGSSFSMRLTAD